MRKILFLCLIVLFAITGETYAEETHEEDITHTEEVAEDKEITVEKTEEITKDDETKVIEQEQEQEKEKKDLEKNIEIQLEYFNGKIFNNRNVNNYNVHVFQQFKQQKVLSMYRGFTVTRATGYSRPEGKGWLDSEGVGVGPAFMLRWTKPVSGKLSLAGDFTGSLMFYNKAHPAEGRAYGFLWRLGPRVLWQSTERDSISLGYSISHFSNGLRSHNPGYNGLGFTLNFQHQFN